MISWNENVSYVDCKVLRQKWRWNLWKTVTYLKVAPVTVVTAVKDAWEEVG